jgi:hypothetical protein
VWNLCGAAHSRDKRWGLATCGLLRPFAPSAFAPQVSAICRLSKWLRTGQKGLKKDDHVTPSHLTRADVEPSSLRGSHRRHIHTCASSRTGRGASLPPTVSSSPVRAEKNRRCGRSSRPCNPLRVRGDPVTRQASLQWAKRGVAAGGSGLLGTLAFLYSKGPPPLPKQPGLAVHYATRGACLGDAQCMALLGAWFKRGREGLPIDPPEGVSWLRKALESPQVRR